MIRVTFFALVILTCAPCFAAPDAARTALHDGWMVQSSCKALEAGKVISTAGFHPQGWYKASVPSTVLAAQVASGEFPDPYFGMNLRKIPGTSYPIGGMFSILPMPADSPYACSWWYRTTFSLPSGFAHRTVWLHFGGINYRANIWLNGHKLAGSDELAGAYRIYEFDATELIATGKNALAVEAFAPSETDLAINWWDWNPTPPDKNMGLWGEVYMTSSGAVSVRHPQVVTHFSDSSLQMARLTVMAELHNSSGQTVSGFMEAVVDRARLSQPVTLQPGETRSVSFTADQFPQLLVKNPRLWWPAGMGQPYLHPASVRFLIGSSMSDEQPFRFGIREVTSELTDKGYRLFRVNGRKLLIRGGGWAPDMLLRQSSQRLKDEFAYVLGMNLNTIRLEGKMETDEFFDLADQYGVLVMAGWCCCDIWEEWDKWPPQNVEIAANSLREQILRMRSHPSLLAWLNASDNPPPPRVEQAYIDVLKSAAWPNPSLSSASDASTPLTGASGVKMTGPYDYEPPSYWLTDHKYGGAYGFNTETSPGPAVPVEQSLRKFIPADRLWPAKDNPVWQYHAGGERFQNLDIFTEAMNATYGSPSDLRDYGVKAQAMAYDGERAMFEAYGRNKYTSTGVIQWMLNNAWPSMIWHLYDYYLQPAGGYFGTRKANEPLHVQYSYDDRSVVAVNSTLEPARGLIVMASAYDFDLNELWSRKSSLDLDPDGVTTAFAVPPLAREDPAVYFIRLKLLDSAGKVLSSNFYWLPAKPATIAFDRTTDTNFTPIAVQEDMTMLNRLPQVRLEAKGSIHRGPAGYEVVVTVSNPTKNLAFQVHAEIQSGGLEVLPVLWDDNYLELMPGESRLLTARYSHADALGRHASLHVDGWNIEPATIELSLK
ncbi:MAG: sugar-binding domain-containing protein [Terriglobales bacterium]